MSLRPWKSQLSDNSWSLNAFIKKSIKTARQNSAREQRQEFQICYEFEIRRMHLIGFCSVVEFFKWFLRKFPVDWTVFQREKYFPHSPLGTNTTYMANAIIRTLIYSKMKLYLNVLNVIAGKGLKPSWKPFRFEERLSSD